MIKFIIKIMVAVAGQIDSKGVEGFYHILPVELVGDEGGGEGIAREEGKRMFVFLFLSLEERLEIGGASFGLLGVGLDVVDIVEVEYCQDLLLLGLLHGG